MMEFVITVFIVGALLGGGSAEDPFCLVQILNEVTPDRFYKSPFSVCQDLENNFARVRSEIKKCTPHKISVDELESLHEDFCEINSDFRLEFNRHEQCFGANLANANPCFEKMGHGKRKYASTKELCSGITQDVLDCMNENIGRRCGDEGFEVFKRMTEAQESLLTGICLETAHSAATRPAFLSSIMLLLFMATKWPQLLKIFLF